MRISFANRGCLLLANERGNEQPSSNYVNLKSVISIQGFMTCAPTERRARFAHRIGGTFGSTIGKGDINIPSLLGG